ncbi:MAG: hypothetical protein EBQ92_07690 [Proteobacteria bacterium]|nr:hypothetical protein [Pseudomonadota bacterium]
MASQSDCAVSNDKYLNPKMKVGLARTCLQGRLSYFASCFDRPLLGFGSVQDLWLYYASTSATAQLR